MSVPSRPFRISAAFSPADLLAAVATLERQWAETPDRPGLAAALAAAYRRDARYADAIRTAATARAQGDDDPQLLFETAVSQSRQGDAVGSLASWDALLERHPGRAAAWFESHGPALELHGRADALRRLERAIACPGANRKYRSLLAAYHRLEGTAPPVAADPRHPALLDALETLAPRLAPDLALFGMSAPLLRRAMSEARVPGLVLEFGVRRGTSIAILADAAGQAVHGFDSFAGLPEPWVNTPAGVLSTGQTLPEVPDTVFLHPGWFDQTLPNFLAATDSPVRFVNIDCDLYSSAKTVLSALGQRLQAGTVLVFDEFIGNRTWRDDEYRAFAEFTRESGRSWRIVALSLATKQVAIRLTA